ncbi:hypothetical protein A3770_09p56010 [Chloropicon primus]|uniref:Autophagy-related protein 27 n=1 Tax=Chloropicon primus TaxID=1764295 RepID=A0A5B8MRK1_9CHLO|nr:hypothetical protein A3770_09p56010 [Chloropicon primus]|eukprot:QDZ23083.1 hypothetical protein A3770_09p56010 [Chloropicon primus]
MTRVGTKMANLGQCFAFSLCLIGLAALMGAELGEAQVPVTGGGAELVGGEKTCVWKSKSGKTFDLNDLSSPSGHYATDWVKGSIYFEKYYFQLCGQMHFAGQNGPYTECNSTLGCPTSCSGGANSCGNSCSALQLQNDPRSYMFSYTYCHTLGQARNGLTSFQLLDEVKPSKGVKYVMNGGDSCGTNGQIVNHTFTVNIVCDKKVKKLPSTFTVSTVNDCAYETTISHRSGCPKSGGASGGLTFGGVFLITFFCGGFTYFVGFFAYNMKFAQLVGMDAIPHKDFWMELPGLAKDGVFFTWEKIQELVSKTRAAYTTLR